LRQDLTEIEAHAIRGTSHEDYSRAKARCNHAAGGMEQSIVGCNL
jgi:hypothetical protein